MNCVFGASLVLTSIAILAALDIQMISQYGQGSGATFGIAASTQSAYYAQLSLHDQSLQFNGMLGLTPLPDILSLSSGRNDLYPFSSLENTRAVNARYEGGLCKGKSARVEKGA